MSNLERYKELFEECREIAKVKPLTETIRKHLDTLLYEADSVWQKLGYKEKEEISNWCAAQQDWIDE